MTDYTAPPATAAPLQASLPARLVQELIDWAREGYPNEACGIIAGDRPVWEGGSALRFHPMRNAANSPLRYHMDAEEQLRVMTAIEDAGEVVWGIFHSHVASAAEPSPTDLGLAFYPDSVYLICSLAEEVPEIRAWRLSEGEPSEVELLVA